MNNSSKMDFIPIFDAEIILIDLKTTIKMPIHKATLSKISISRRQYT
jgi:hypothetical protein